MGLITLVVDVTVLVYFFGISIGVHHYLLVVNVLLSTNNTLKKSIGLPLTLAMLILYVALIFYSKTAGTLYTIPPEHSIYFRETNIVLAFTVLSLSLYRFHIALNDAELS